MRYLLGNIPTALSLSRIFVSLMLIKLFFVDVLPWGKTSCLIGIGIVSDILDGLTARWLKVASSFGAGLDRIADKLFVVVSLVLLSTHSFFLVQLQKALITSIILLEGLLACLLLFGAVFRLDIHSSRAGKEKMHLECLGILLWSVAGYFNMLEISAQILIIIFLSGANIFAILSIFSYLKKWR